MCLHRIHGDEIDFLCMRHQAPFYCESGAIRTIRPHLVRIICSVQTGLAYRVTPITGGAFIGKSEPE